MLVKMSHNTYISFEIFYTILSEYSNWDIDAFILLYIHSNKLRIIILRNNYHY